MGYLSRNGQPEAIDSAMVECLALAVVRQRSLQAEIDKAGVMVGGKPHAALRKIEAAASTVLKYAYLLGLAPATRRAPAATPAAAAKRSAKATRDVWRGVLK
jgi:hypothetical protein